MHNIEPYYNWRHIYVSEEDQRSPFYNRQYSEFEFTATVYNYYIHPQWDDFGSRTLYLKVLLADYDEKYVVIELIGEWNDAIENDIMELKREVIDKFMEEGVYKFVLIAENVLNFHSGDKDYYQEWFEEVTDENGWIVSLNMPQATQHDFKKAKLNYYVELMEIDNWRIYKPFHLFKKNRQRIKPPSSTLAFLFLPLFCRFRTYLWPTKIFHPRYEMVLLLHVSSWKKNRNGADRHFPHLVFIGARRLEFLHFR